MKLARFSTILAVLLLAASCTGHSLFRDGKTDYTIVVAPDAPESERYAAAELQFWLKEVSGAELPITDLQGGKKGKRLVVGYNSLLKELYPQAEEPDGSDDSFTLLSRGGDVLFWGGAERGTLYSVYSFLEDQLGCRWYSSKVSVAPKKASWSFGKLENHEEPGIIMRDNLYQDIIAHNDFAARVRNNSRRLPSIEPGKQIIGTAEGYWGAHSMGAFVPYQKYFDSHPEYFSELDGKRVKGYTQLCLSNPEVLQLCIDGLREVMRNEPDYLIYSMEQMDSHDFCTCDECKALAEKYGGQSGVMVWFVNQVADAVKEEFPDKFVGTFAYQYTRHAPKNIVPRDNVVIRLCSIECCMWHDYDECEDNKTFLKDLQDWSAIAPHLYIWDYVTNFSQYNLPVANWNTLQSHIKDFRDYHAIGILEEGDYHTLSCEMREMRTWILSKLLWNPEADVQSLIQDFTDGYYGPAGPFIREYLDLEERILRRPGIHSDCYISSSDPMYTDEFVQEGRKIFAAAKEAVASDEDLLARVEAAEMPLCFLLMEKDPVKGIQEGAADLFKRVVQREGIDRMSESGSAKRAQDYIDYYDKLTSAMDDAHLMPAQKASTSGNGVAFTRYEGFFKMTSDMFSGKGRVTGKGVLPAFTIDQDKDADHFGYVFDSWVKVEESGLHFVRISSDDGAVLFVDGEEVLNLDGSHFTTSGFAALNLEKGMHRLKLHYFEDYSGQELVMQVTTPGGYSGPIPESNLFVPGK